MPFEDKNPDPIDVHVGARVRLRRKFLGMSQEALAVAIGLTFQQVQKYERGSNRISASKLYRIAKVLTAPMNYFFDGAPDPDGDIVPDAALAEPERRVNDFLMTSEGVELAQYFPGIERARTRRRVLDLVRSLAED